jgi:hypothetical protein
VDDAVEPDIHLIGTLLALRRVMPEASKRAARTVVSTLVADIERRFTQPIRSAVTGALHRASRVNRPRHRDIDWDRTIRVGHQRSAGGGSRGGVSGSPLTTSKNVSVPLCKS